MNAHHPYLPQFGFRTESSRSVRKFVESPFYFRRPSEFDKFEERADIEIPAGKEPAGIWFFNSISALTNSVLSDSFTDSQFIARIRTAALNDISFVVEDQFLNKDAASIAVTFYDPAVITVSETDGQFVTALTVPDDLIDVWIGDKWVRKNEIGLLDFDIIIASNQRGDYEPPTPDQSLSPIGNEPHVRREMGEDWRRPPADPPREQSGPIARSIDAIRQGFRRARYIIELRKLRQEERRFQQVCEWHVVQADIFKADGDDDGERLHSIHAKFREADTKRFRHEQQMIQTGKTFWELHDINAWAEKALQLQRIDSPDLLYTELPSGAIHPLVERMNKIKREAQRALFGKAHAKYVAQLGQNGGLAP